MRCMKSSQGYPRNGFGDLSLQVGLNGLSYARKDALFGAAGSVAMPMSCMSSLGTLAGTDEVRASLHAAAAARDFPDRWHTAAV